jgi:hypothetical protein
MDGVKLKDRKMACGAKKYLSPVSSHGQCLLSFLDQTLRRYLTDAIMFNSP